jgi:enoyl-CoA hydratase/carnithine racemase
MSYSQNRLWERKGDLGILSLQGTGGNYLDEPEFIPYRQLEGYINEPGLKGIIIRGNGRHFSAGADLERLRQLVKDETLLYERMSAGKNLIFLIENAPFPIIAEISGVCFGAGLEIALACHIRICSDNALFAFPEVNFGIMPGLGGTILLPKVIGQGKAAEMILSGDVVNAEKALELKLVDYVVPAKDLHDFTVGYVEKLTCDREIEVIQSVMRSIRNSLEMDLNSAMEEETKLFCSLAARNIHKK